jgi:2-oxoglutarate dehydrogenase E1 component
VLLQDENLRRQIGLVRVEQFYPFPKAAIQAELERYRNVTDVVWVQEEPANMGAWFYMQPRLNAMLEALHGDCNRRVRYVGRPASASPATGSAKVHQVEQETVVREALTL